jgi:hypothetical protein
MKSMLARIAARPAAPVLPLVAHAGEQPAVLGLILTWLPTWPASAIDGSSSSMHSLSRCRSSAICDPEPAISSTMPIGWLAFSKLEAFAVRGSRQRRRAPPPD